MDRFIEMFVNDEGLAPLIERKEYLQSRSKKFVGPGVI